MAWIEAHQNLTRHPKTLRAAAALGVSRITMTGHLIAFWGWALDSKPDGGPVDDIDVRAGAEYEGDGDITAAMLGAGFLDDRDGELWIHDWDDYAGRLIQQRAANKQRMRRARASHVRRTERARAGATEPNPTVPNQTEPEEIDQSFGIDEVAAPLRDAGILIESTVVGAWISTYGEIVVRSAIEKALASGGNSARYVETILENGGGRTAAATRRKAVGDPYEHLYQRD